MISNGQDLFSQMVNPSQGMGGMSQFDMGAFQNFQPMQNMQQFPPQQPQYDFYGHSDFYENLVGKITRQELSRISDEIKRGVDSDLQSRKEWDQKLATGIKQLGLVTEKNSQDYSTAGGLFSSAFMQAILNSLAQYCSVLLPPAGPARIKTMNNIKEKKLREYLTERASDVSSFINNLLTDLSPDYYPESEQAFFWTLLYGSCFKKVYFDDARALPVSHLIKPQDLIINNNAVNLLTAPRLTHRFYLTQRELKIHQMTGFYADVPIQSYKNYDDSPIQDILSEIDGINRDSFDRVSDQDNLYQICESRVDQVLPYLQQNPTIPCPYVATFEFETGTMVGLRRNWLKHDPYAKRINDLIHFPLIPGPGIYGLGYIHIMGSNAEAATELLRQLIFSGKLSNFPAFIRAKGMRMDNSTIMLQPGQSAEIETGNKSVQDCLMKVPFGEPSPALKQIKDDLEQNIGGLSNSLNSTISEFNPNAAVGTTLAMIEQASKVESSIIRRLHKAMSEELNLIYKLVFNNFEKMQNAFMAEGKTLAVTKQDFQIDLQILPTADPNLATSTHLLMQSEALSSVYVQFPNLINPRSVAELRLKALKISDVDSFLMPEQADVQPKDPISENMDMIEGKPANAGIEQNHQAHIQTHNGLLTNPAIMNDPAKMALVGAHIQQHYAFDYQLQMQQLMGGVQVSRGAPEEQQSNPEHENQIAQQAAQATQTLIQQQQQALQGGQPQQADPTQVLMADIKSKEDAMNQKAQNDFLRAEIDKYKIDKDFQLKQEELDFKYQSEQSQQQHERNLQEQQMAMDQLNQDNEQIKFQIEQIMGRFENLSTQQMQQQHEREQQEQQHQHEQMQQQSDQMNQQQQSIQE
jgi:hypothetical protein